MVCMQASKEVVSSSPTSGENNAREEAEMTREVQELRDSVHKTERDISAFERQMWDDEQVCAHV